ncbi:hypothetical protein [Bradyrhizobium sp. HKCCYLS20291]|uniref:hypothetical protein n=1 Tax=Bradyrhizobium sp. HKCCYLS20291 TaxID=3420766 RepID=UPI003EBBF255
MTTDCVTDGAASSQIVRPIDAPAEPDFALLQSLSLANWPKFTLETSVLLAATAILTFWLPNLSGIPGLPQPYWIPVLLISSQYGVFGATIAASAASLLYLLELPAGSAAQDLYVYASAAALQPTLWLTTALVLGGLRSLQIHQASELANELSLFEQRANDLADGLENALKEITALERRIATDAATVATFTEALSRIDLSSRASAAVSLGDLFRTATGAQDFTVFVQSDGHLRPVLAIENDMRRPLTSVAPLDGGGEPSEDPVAPPIGQRTLVLRSNATDRHPPIAAIRYLVPPDASNDQRLDRRLDDLKRAFSTILSKVHEQQA